MKQILSLILSFIMIFSVMTFMTSCNVPDGEESGSSSTSSTGGSTNQGTEPEGEKVIGEVVLLAASLSATDSQTKIYLKPTGGFEGAPLMKFNMAASQIQSGGEAVLFGRGSKAEITYTVDAETGEKTAVGIKLLDDATTTTWPEPMFNPQNAYRIENGKAEASGKIAYITRVNGDVGGYLVYVKVNSLYLQAYWVEDNYSEVSAELMAFLEGGKTDCRVSVISAATEEYAAALKLYNDEILLVYSMEIQSEDDAKK